MTANELTQYVGKLGLLQGSDRLSFEVEVKDARLNFGAVQLQVIPKCGVGIAWVSLHRVVFS